MIQRRTKVRCLHIEEIELKTSLTWSQNDDSIHIHHQPSKTTYSTLAICGQALEAFLRVGIA